MEHFSSRARYEGTLRLLRAQHILTRIEEFHPRSVVLYGHMQFWTQILTVRQHSDRVAIGDLGTTRVIVTTHPTAHRTTNQQWDDIGRLMERTSPVQH